MPWLLTRGAGAAGVAGGAGVAALALAAPASALAQPVVSVDVEAEHERGRQARAEHRDAEALEIFRGLYERTGEARALARMALAEAALDRWVDAEAHLADALARTADPWIAQNREALDAQLRLVRERVGSLEVVSATPGAEVWLGEARVASLPLARPLRVVAGAVTFEVRAPGYLPAVRTVRVEAGEGALTRARVDLARPAPPPAPSSLVVGPRPPPSTGPRLGTTLGVVALGAAGVGLATGVAGLLVRGSHVATFNGAGCWLADAGPMGPSACGAEYDAGSTAEAFAAAGFAVAGVAAVAGVVFLWADGGARRERGAALACGAGPGAVGVSCGARF